MTKHHSTYETNLPPGLVNGRHSLGSWGLVLQTHVGEGMALTNDELHQEERRIDPQQYANSLALCQTHG